MQETTLQALGVCNDNFETPNIIVHMLSVIKVVLLAISVELWIDNTAVGSKLLNLIGHKTM